MQEVIIALQPISRNSKFLVGSIGRQDWPLNSIPPDIIADEAETIGKLARTHIAEGQVIVRDMLVSAEVLEKPLPESVRNPLSTHRIKPQSNTSTQIIVAKIPINIGDEFTPDSMERQLWPSNEIPSNIIAHEAETIGRVANQAIAKGQPILRSMLIHSMYQDSIRTPPPIQTPMSSSELASLQRKLAFMTNVNGSSHIYVMNFDETGQYPLVNDIVVTQAPVWSPDGQLIAFVSQRDGNEEIYIMDSDGNNQIRLTNNETIDLYPTWSPDGKYIAFTSCRDDANGEIYVMNSDGTNQIRLTNNTFTDSQPAWSPDGKHIAFVSQRQPNRNIDIYIMNTDGTNQTALITNEGINWFPAWSPDNRHIAYVLGYVSPDDIYIVDVDGTNNTRLTQSGSFDFSPTWSPDGKYIAFESMRDGHREIYVMNSDGTNQTRLTNNGAENWSPAWSP